MRVLQLLPASLMPTWALIGLILLTMSPASAGTKFKVLYSFKGGSEGGGLYSGIVLDAKGNLYGGTVGGGTGGVGTIYELEHRSEGHWSKSIIHSFDFHSEGGNPNGGMVFDQTGNLYGTTSEGGPGEVGTIFKLTPGSEWTLSVLYDGGSGVGLAINKSTDLYGFGGPGKYGQGNVFELSPNSGGWDYTELYSFGGHQGDGAAPRAAPTLASSGNLYGTTQAGGNGYPKCPGSGGCGIAFKLTPTSSGEWKERILHKFAAFRDDGELPFAGLVLDPSGNLYGTTLEGGTHRDNDVCRVGCGTVFKLTEDTNGQWKETILYNFPLMKDGVGPVGTLTMDQAGNLYGATGDGGNACRCGVVFEMSPQANGQWKYRVLHRFNFTDGTGPISGVIWDGKGHLYGTTIYGGSGRFGVVFEITP
jgi:uncharacterized repeat protein (TIGR03803 family)